MRVRDICATVIGENGYEHWEEVFEELVVERGPSTGAWEYGTLQWPDERMERLNPDMEISDDFFIAHYIGHYPIFVIRFYESQLALEEELLGDRGVFNAFTTDAFAFVRGTLRRFRCFYVDGVGVERALEKRWQRKSDVNPFRREFAARRLEWC